MPDRQTPSREPVLTHPDLRKALAAIDAVTGRLSPGVLDAAPPGAWSVAQILEHLGKAFGSTAYILDRCVTDGAPKGRPPSLRQRFFTTIVVDVGYFPGGIKAPAMTLPDGLGGEPARAFARDRLRALDEAAARCLDRFGPRAIVADHPILGGFTVPQWQRFHWRHTRHHMRQIEARRL